MAEEMVKVKAEDFAQLVRDVAVLKNLLLYEGALSDWAKEELKKSREISVSECVSQEEVRELLDE
jgi:hypothetical protein